MSLQFYNSLILQHSQVKLPHEDTHIPFISTTNTLTRVTDPPSSHPVFIAWDKKYNRKQGQGEFVFSPLRDFSGSVLGRVGENGVWLRVGKLNDVWAVFWWVASQTWGDI